MKSNNGKVILSGMRPTGKLHIGHYVGALENWVALQKDYKNYHLIADYHTLTTNLDTTMVFEDSIEMAIDWIASGIDPEKSPIFRQSKIKEHTELFLIFSMLITKARLEKNPTLKEQIKAMNLHTITYGHLGYPVLQAADILLYKGDLVPVGEDQVPHVEITRQIAGVFNEKYCLPDGHSIFPIPEPKITQFARLPGLDGKAKMSKSLDNTILLSDDEEKIKTKMKKAFTDPNKLRKGDKGNPDICLVYTYHKKFNGNEINEIREGCKSGSLGCFDCKMNISSKISGYFAPIREKRAELEQKKKEVLEILEDGENKARSVAVQTMTEVREAMKLG
ncbi:MAG TPA: tryptophan--tRNA ligase [Ignavibacteria bacterium]|nr:tryptophan--tRNA ligase [Ignavibacteria bacterium]